MQGGLGRRGQACHLRSVSTPPRPAPNPSRGADGTYLDLTVGHYSLALAARSVLTVAHDVDLGRGLSFGGGPLRAVDLAVLFGAAPRRRVPFAVAFENDGTIGAVGVDNVGHLRRQHDSPITAIPAFGLARPELIEGGLREEGRLLLLLRPAALIELTSLVSA
jgi:hypothetical protein